MGHKSKIDEERIADEATIGPVGPNLKRRSAIFQLLAAGTGLAAVALLAPRRAHAGGRGKCTVSGCYCCSYRGNDDNCSNCGHLYSDHGGQTCS